MEVDTYCEQVLQAAKESEHGVVVTFEEEGMPSDFITKLEDLAFTRLVPIEIKPAKIANVLFVRTLALTNS